LREKVLRDLASRAAKDPAFLRRARADLRGTLASHGYRLTVVELGLVKGLLRKTAGMSNQQVARMLTGGLAGRPESAPAHPAPPRVRGSDPTKPSRPESR
jgi:hypothetical protein